MKSDKKIQWLWDIKISNYLTNMKITPHLCKNPPTVEKINIDDTTISILYDVIEINRSFGCRTLSPPRKIQLRGLWETEKSECDWLKLTPLKAKIIPPINPWVSISPNEIQDSAIASLVCTPNSVNKYTNIPSRIPIPFMENGTSSTTRATGTIIEKYKKETPRSSETPIK